MGAVIGSIAVDVMLTGLGRANADLTGLKGNAKGASDALDKTKGASEGGSKAADKLADSANKASKAFNLLASAAAGFLAAFSISKIIAMTDAWSDMQSRIGAATKSMEGAPALMQRLVDVANSSYSPIAQTVEIYSRNVAVLRDLGKTANETADFTESLNHMLVITATRGERAASVQNALSKAMAVGKLEADGLETVLANGGRVAEALAEELDTTVSGLRAMASEGKITGAVIAEALLTSLEDVRAEAALMPATITDAFVILNNNVLEAVGTFDKMTGASAKVAEAIIWVADNLDTLSPIFAGVAAVIVVALVPALGAAAVATWTLTAALLANPLTWVALAIGAVVAAAVLLIQRMGGIEEAFLNVKTTAMDVWGRIKSGGQSLSDVMQGVALMIQGAFTRAFANIAQAFAGLVGSLGGAAGMLGLDATGAADFATGLHTQAAAQEAGSQIAFGNAANNWGKATGAGPKMDNVGLGASWGDMSGAGLGANDNDTPGAVGGGGGAAAKASAYDTLTESIRKNIEVMMLEAETIGLTEQEMVKQKTAFDLLQAAKEAGRPITAELTEEINSLAQAYADATLVAEGAALAVEDPLPWEIAQQEIAALDAALAAGVISWQQYGSAVVRTQAVAAASVLGSVGQITGALANAFKENKAFAIANAVVSTAEGIAKSLSLPFPLNWIQATAVGISGAAQIAAISSASPGGGATPRTPSAPAAPVQQNNPQRQQTETAPTRTEVTIKGLDKSRLYDGETVERLIEAIIDRSKDGQGLDIRIAS